MRAGHARAEEPRDSRDSSLPLWAALHQRAVVKSLLYELGSHPALKKLQNCCPTAETPDTILEQAKLLVAADTKRN